MVEMLVAAAMTALVAASSATFISALSDASLTTRDVRGATSAGHYALMQIGKTIREARAVGQVTSTTVNLWLKDADNDDQVDLYETGVIRYDSSNHQIAFEYLQSSSGPTPTTKVPTATLKDYSVLTAAMPSGDKRAIVWCTDVDSLTFRGNPSYTDTRMIEVVFTINNNGQPMTFRAADNPRASADYLFYSETQGPPPPGSTRKSRKLTSRWTGFIDLGTLTTIVEL